MRKFILIFVYTVRLYKDILIFFLSLPFLVKVKSLQTLISILHFRFWLIFIYL